MSPEVNYEDRSANTSKDVEMTQSCLSVPERPHTKRNPNENKNPDPPTVNKRSLALFDQHQNSIHLS